MLDPGHAPAMWNRAVALELLDRGTEAQQAYDALADRAEAGWSEEARKRALALRNGAR